MDMPLDKGTSRARIIAVFGGATDNVTFAAAEHLGALIAEAKSIVLTGAFEPSRDSVKGIALSRAKQSPWIGVDRKRGGTVEWSELDSGFRLRSNLDHKRNFLEACMCDGTAALAGGDGTLSEVACALWLGRPVAFVGDHWKEVCDLESHRERAVRRLLTAVDRRFGASRGTSAIDPLLRNLRQPVGIRSKYRYFHSQASKEATEWLVQILNSPSNRRGHFPSIAGHEQAAAAYESWLLRRASRE